MNFHLQPPQLFSDDAFLGKQFALYRLLCNNNNNTNNNIIYYLLGANWHGNMIKCALHEFTKLIYNEKILIYQKYNNKEK